MSAKRQEKPDSHEEEERLEKLFRYEDMAAKAGHHYVAGLDEAGRGPLAGPVAAAAVILPRACHLPGVNDSKALSDKKRQVLAREIKEQAQSWAVAMVAPQRIDEINILQATRQAMQMAIEALSIRPDFLLIDALQLPDIHIKQYPIIKGDSLSISIASASILAKVERDALMRSYGELFPQYGFARHKGYGTREHLQALQEYGPCPIHRYTFEPIRSIIGGSHGSQPGLFYE